MTSPSHRSLVVALSLFLLATAASADRLILSQQPVDRSLFSEAAVDTRRVVPNAAAVADGARRLELELLDGRYTARLSDLEVRGPGDVTWRGFVADDYRVTLTLKHGYVVGMIYTPDGVYELSTLRDGSHGLARLDQALFPACATDSRGESFEPAKGPTAPLVDEPGLVDIDVLGVYTDLARQGAGGPGQIAATIQAAVDNANTGFTDSLMDARFTLVHTAEVPWTENGNGSAALSWARSDPHVLALRNEFQADMVGMTIENWGSACGVAYVMRDPSHTFAPSAYQVTRRSCAVGNLTYAHEHGHNMGFEHDPANGAPPGSASWPYAFGHFVNGSYRTIMSYSSPCSQGCTRVAHWSNPNVTQNGQPTGIANERENWRAGNNNDEYTVDFRDRPVGVSVSGGSCPGTITVDVTNASPSSEVFVVQGVPGTFQLRGSSCIGSILPAAEPFGVVTRKFSDGSGAATFDISVGAASCGQPLFAFDIPSCSASDVTSVP